MSYQQYARTSTSRNQDRTFLCSQEEVWIRELMVTHINYNNHNLYFSQDDNSMDYSSQDSIPIDFSRNNKIDMMHGHLTNVMMEEDMLDRRNNVILVRQ